MSIYGITLSLAPAHDEVPPSSQPSLIEIRSDEFFIKDAGPSKALENFDKAKEIPPEGGTAEWVMKRKEN